MYLINRLLNSQNIPSIEKNSIDKNITVPARFNYWIEVLTQRACRLFEWKGLPDSCPPFEVEERYILQGYCIFSDKPFGELTAFFGAPSNLTGRYFDVPLEVTYNSPSDSGSFEVGSDCIFGRNTAFLNAVLPIIEYYALLLANIDTSFFFALINDRQKGGVPTASTRSAIDTIKNYRRSLMIGKFMPIYDPAFTQVKFMPTDLHNASNLSEYTEIVQDTLNRFYNDIGVKTSKEKKGNMIAEEVNANSAMLLLNIGDMLEQRRKTADDLNKKYNLNVTVDICDEIKSAINFEKENGGDDYE